MLEIRAHSYQNSDHLERSGDCCDYAIFTDCGYCDNQFVFCLRGSSTSNGNSNNCPLGSYSTEGYIEDDSFTFRSPSFNGVPNPMTFRGNVWPVIKLIECRKCSMKLTMNDQEKASIANSMFALIMANPLIIMMILYFH